MSGAHFGFERELEINAGVAAFQRFEVPVGISRFTMGLVRLASVGLLIRAEWSAEKISAQSLQDRRRASINPFLCPWGHGKWRNLLRSQSKGDRSQVTAKLCNRCTHGIRGKLPRGLAVNECGFHRGGGFKE